MNVNDLAFARDVFTLLAVVLLALWAYEAGWPKIAAWRARRRRNRVMRDVLPPPSAAVERGQRAVWRREWRA